MKKFIVILALLCAFVGCEKKKGDHIVLLNDTIEIGSNTSETVKVYAYEGFIEISAYRYKSSLGERLYPGQTLDDTASRDKMATELARHGYTVEQVNKAITNYWEQNKN